MPFQQFVISDEGGKRAYRLPVANQVIQFQQSPLDANLERAEPVQTFERALTALATMAETTDQIQSDQRLSEVGKKERIDPVRLEGLSQIAGLSTQVDDFEAHTNQMEAQLHKVPALDPAHHAMALEDREIRDWLRSQAGADRAGVLQRMASDPGQERLLLAILRSPIPQSDHEVELARTAWNRRAAERDPAMALAVEQRRSVIEWSRSGLAQVAALALNHSRIEGRQVLRLILSSSNEVRKKGVGVFGFKPADVADMHRRLDSERHTRAA